MVIGVIFVFLGVLYVLVEQDIKWLLVWSIVENVGIILLVVGVVMVGLLLYDLLFIVVGLFGVLFYLFNYVLFKGLLFFGVGVIILCLYIYDMEKMGVLVKWMLWIVVVCLIGCFVILVIFLLNGFISEWYIWQLLFLLSCVEVVVL